MYRQNLKNNGTIGIKKEVEYWGVDRLLDAKIFAINASGSFIGSIIFYSFGANLKMLELLVLCLFVSFLSSIFADIVEKTFNTMINFRNAIKKVAILFLVVLAHRIDIFLNNGDIIMTATILFFITNEIVLILDNYRRMGLPIPDKFKDIVNLLNSKKN